MTGITGQHQGLNCGLFVVKTSFITIKNIFRVVSFDQLWDLFLPVCHYYLVNRCRLATELPPLNPMTFLHTIQPTFRGRETLDVASQPLAEQDCAALDPLPGFHSLWPSQEKVRIHSRSHSTLVSCLRVFSF